MSGSDDDTPPTTIRVHRPPPVVPGADDDRVDEDVDRGTFFAGYPSSAEKPVVPLSPRTIVIVLLVALGLLTLYATLPSIIGGGGGRNRNAQFLTPSSAPATPTTSGPTAPATGVPPPLPTTAVAAPPPTAAAPAGDDALQLWYDASGAPIVDRLDTIISTLEDDVAARDVAGVAAGCEDLGVLADDALSQRPPGSDSGVAQGWDNAGDFLASAADDCVSAAGSGDDALLRSALDQATDALAYAQRAANAADDLL